MKMFKKILSVVLAVLMIATLVVAAASCKKKEETKTFKAALICLHGDSSTYDKNFIDAMDRAEELASKPMRPLKGRILSSEADFLSLAEKIRSNER